jgi:hypothetical protein
MMGYGYENAAGDRISALIDMINGGGPGRSGGTFEGGGILSLLANAVAKPYGSVRERPGHTPVGAAAAPMGATAVPMDVLRSEPVDTAVLPDDDTAVPVDLLRSVVEGAIDRAEERPSLPGLAEEGYRDAISRPARTGGRTFMEEDLAVLGNLHPDLAALFRGMRPGDPLSPQQAMFLDAARVGSAEPTATLTPPQYTVRKAPPLQGPPVPAPTSAPESLYPPSGFTLDQLERMSPQMRAMAEEHNLKNLGRLSP